MVDRPDSQSAKLAVLIDADNTSAKIAERLFEEISVFGEASVRRIYGDFASPYLKGWNEVLAKYAIKPHHQVANTVGKNSSDIALVIDAMDLLHSNRFDGFCLVSSDCDFAGLAGRIREHGLDVWGFGERKTPESFRAACKRFIYTENLRSDTIEALDSKAAEASKAASGATLIHISKAKALLFQALGDLEDEGGTVLLSTLGSQLVRTNSDFDPRSYGFKKLGDLVKNVDDLKVTEGPANQLYVKRAK